MTSRMNILMILALTLSLGLGTGCADLLDDVLQNESDDGSGDDPGAVDPAGPPDPDSANQPPVVFDPVGAPDPGTGTTTPEPDPIPDVTATLNNALIRILIVGGSLTASVEADWTATGASDLMVDLEVLSSITYRAWTPLLTNQPASYFESTTFAVTQGERRFDFRIVAHDAAGNEWISNVFTVQ